MNITTERLKNVSFLDSLNVIFIMTLSFYLDVTKLTL